MAKRIKNFVDRAFSRTVDLELLHRLLSPYLGQIDFDWNGLPEDEGKRREAIFALFARADLRFPAKLQFALYNITTLSTDAGARIMELYRRRIDGRTKTGDERELARKIDEIERQLRLAGLGAERDEIYRNARARKISDEAARKLVREIDLMEERIGSAT